MIMNRQWLLAARPDGPVKDSDFEWRQTPLAPLAVDQLLIRTIYISLDPTNRAWMNAADTYLPAVPLGSVMRGGGMGVVEESRHPGFAAGDIVQGLLGWQEYCVCGGAGLVKIPKGLPVPLTAFFGLIGHIGLTAYFGLLDIGKPAAGETLVVSAAAGAVGSLVGQIGKIKDCRVVGIAGSDEKCRWIQDELGFDAALNYRTEEVPAGLARLCPSGIDIYFDNVGGSTLEACLSLINLRARIALCGMISQYNATRAAPGPSNLANLIVKRARMEGFLCTDYGDRAQEAFPHLIQWHMSGRLKYRVDVVEDLANAPRALRKLFDGSNTGKLLVKVGPEPGQAAVA